MELGNFRCNFIYYDLFLSLLDFEKDYMKLIQLSEILVADILFGNVFSVFDFFFKRKILIKYFKVQYGQLYNENINDLLEITNKSLTDKEMITENFSGNIVFTELLLSHGFLNYIGANGKIDYKLAEKCLKESFKNSGNNSYKRFCYSYIFKIRMRRLGYKKEKSGKHIIEAENSYLKNNLIINNFAEKNNIDNPLELEFKKAYSTLSSKEEKQLNDKKITYDGKEIVIGKKLSETKNKLFKIYNDSIIEGNLQDFSSSYFYFMGKIFENGWGCKLDEITAFCFFIHGRDAKIKNLGTGSVISYYRRFKSIKKLGSEKYEKVKSDLENVKNKISLSLDEKECFICFENEKNTILFPCKHMMCLKCYDKIKQTARCPTCRTKILLVR